MIARQVKTAGTTGTIRDLGEGAWQFQAPLWQTNSLLATANGEGLVCDPAFTPGEIEAIRAEAEVRAGGPLHFLVTHGDFDHICGIPYFADAEVVAGEETARRVEAERTPDDLAAAGAEWGADWRTEGLRVDRVVAAGSEFACGAFRIAALEAPSHGREGLAFVLLDQGILLPGDHLSAITYPLVAGSVARTAAADEQLLEALDRFAPRWVVPGHGPALTAADARAIGEADLAYLRALDVAAREAVADGLSPGYALLHVFAVEPPRANTDDFEVYAIRAGNARQALAEVGSSA
jgi:glyoxylase-like metal-dependent hydrolase (beta-lactamase superfamily II)